MCLSFLGQWMKVIGINKNVYNLNLPMKTMEADFSLSSYNNKDKKAANDKEVFFLQTHNNRRDRRGKKRNG